MTKVEERLHLDTREYKQATIDKQISIKQMKRPSAIYATFADASFAENEPIPMGHSKYVTYGIIKDGKNFVQFHLFSNSLTSKEYRSLFSLLEECSFVTEKNIL